MADRTVNVKLRGDVAQYMASMRAAGGATRELEKAARDVRKAHDEEADAAGRVRTAEAKLNELRADSKTKVSQLAAAEEQLAKAHRSLEVAQDRTSAATARFTQAQKAAGEAAGEGLGDGVAGGIDKSSGKVDKATERMAKRTNAQFDAMKFTALSVGLPAAAAVGAAGAGLLLAAIPALFIGIAAAAVMGNEKVSSSFDRLSSLVAVDTQRMAGSLEGPIASAADDLGASFDRLEPQITAAFNGSAPAVKTLAGTVTDFAENAMPGLVVAVNSSKAPLEGLRSIAGQTGAGVTDMFVNMSSGSQAAGASMVTVGGIVQDLLGFIGKLLAQLANGSGGPLMMFRAGLQQAESALLALTANGSGAIGFLTGFTSAGTGALAIINLLAQALSILPSGVTQAAGSIAAAGMLLSKFGVDVGAGFTGLGDSVRKAGTDMTGAAKAGTKVGTALGGLVVGALNPATLAVVALGLGLSILGDKQKEAAAAAAAHQGRVQSLAQALRESNGAIDANVRSMAAKELQDFKVQDGVRDLLGDVGRLAGQEGIQQLNDAYLGNAAAGATLLSGLKAEQKQLHDNAYSATGLTNAEADRLNLLDHTIPVLQDANSTFAEAAQKNRDLASATAASGRATTELSAVMEVLRGTAASTSDRVTALKTALDILAGRTPTFEEAIQAGNDQLRNFAESMKDGVKHTDGFGRSLLNADGTVNTFTKNGSGLQDLAEGLQTSFVNAASGIDEMVRRGVPFDVATKRVNDGLSEQRNRFVDVAEKMGLSATQANNLADKYGLIPTAVTTNITANVKQAQDAIAALPAVAANTAGAVIISANTDPATGKIMATVQYADGSTGVITVDGDKDPATGKIDVAVQYANGQRSFMNIDAFNQAAKDRTIEAKRMADGTVAWIIVGANTGSANTAIDQAARPRTATINVIVRQKEVVNIPGMNIAMKAKGGLVGYASGGEVTSVPRLAGGQRALDVRSGGRLAGPGTGTSDDMLLFGSNKEFVVNAKDTANNLGLLRLINAGKIKSFAGGGMVQAEDGSWVPSSFYDKAPAGPHAMYTESGFAKLRAWATADGIGSLSATDQDQLRTYGGWSDVPKGGAVVQGIQSGNVVQQAMSAHGAGGTTVTRFEFGKGTGTLEQALLQWLRNSVRSQGGNVQKVLGKS